MLQLLFLLLPLAAASGWYAAYHHFYRPHADKKNGLNREYLLGLNYLLNEQADKAVDTFIRILEVDTETVEIHLALGALFRRRGEIDRAIRLHQNLIARPQLCASQKMQALLALSQDYYHAGLLDRAEHFFFKIVSNTTQAKSEFYDSALNYLLAIYQQQKRWDYAINIAKKISKTKPTIINNIAHYYCELALDTLKNKSCVKEAQHLLKKALRYDRNCVRASLIQGEMAMQEESWQKAINIYQKIKQQDPDYITETLVPLRQCYMRCTLGEADWLNYLYTILSEYSKVSIYLAIVKFLKKSDIEKAQDFLIQQLQNNPSLYGLYELIDLYSKENSSLEKNSLNEEIKENALTNKKLVTIKIIIDNILENKFYYRCLNCGFNSKFLDWLCPACRKWNTIKPNIPIEYAKPSL